MWRESSLTEFISCYLNQDWMDLAPTPWAAVRLYAYDEGPVEEIAEAAEQARELVSLHLPSEELYRRLEEDHGLQYWAARDGYEANDWLSQVAGVLEDAVAQRRADEASGS